VHEFLSFPRRDVAQLGGEEFCCAQADLAAGILYARESGGRAVAVDVIVAKAEERNVIGHAAPRCGAGMPDDEGERVICSEDAAGDRQRRDERGQLPANHSPGVLFPQGMGREEERVSREVASFKRAGETLPAFASIATRSGQPGLDIVKRCSAADIREIRKAKADEMIGGHAADLMIVGDHAWEPVGAAFAADIDHGHARPLPGGSLFLGHAEGDDPIARPATVESDGLELAERVVASD
jgi:hypothetical protein